MDLDVFVLCIGVPTQTWKFLIYTHWVYPPQGEQRQSIPPFFGLLVLASSFTIYTRPLPSSFVFNPTYYLTYGMEDLFHTRTFVGQTSLFLVCLGSELVTELAFGELDCMPKSFWSVVLMFGTVQNSPQSLEMLLAKTESSCTTCIGNAYICAHGKCKF